ncbi:GHMP kinase [Pelagibacterium sp. H642]|uniref:GHMP family kinase ATP-binding protein n=1 Tax=Pelagibacterium sp. H642 TaxID=1881069 RepID=UPI0028154D8A|nr:GHMP kinase [Pelagibacterium sp. H642]WMT92546.1 GHMP kinase [Pelagibacterium sp. H642]
MHASGWAIGHHGEILQGVFHGDDHRLHRGLVTLPFTSRYSIAVAEAIEGDEIIVYPKHKRKARDAMEHFLREMKHDQKGIRLIVSSNIPEGFGLGSSTTDIVATIRATAKLLGTRLKPSALFRLAVRTEAASDGTMFSGKPRLVCQREGTVLERFRRKIPEFSLISVNVAPDQPVDTLIHPPARYNEQEISEFEELRRLMRRALRTASLSDLGKVATRSAIINQRYLPQPHFAAILDLCRSKGAFGVQVAHSGRMVGILLDPSLDRDDRTVRHIQSELLRLSLFSEFLKSPHR